MKKTFVILSAAAMTLIAGCQKENFGSMDSNRTVLNVGINEAKTTLGELDGTKRPVYWANGDVLRANDLTSDALSGLPEKCKSASFTFEGTLTYPANLLYPKAYYKDAQTITLPELQAKTTNVPLYGYAESDADVQMNALLALIRIPVKQGEDKDVLKSIVVESKTDDYCLSGDFTIDYQTGALTPGAGASAKTGMNFTTQLNPDTAVDFFIAVPAGEGVSLSVKFKDQMGHCMTKTLSNKTFVAGQVSALPEIVFAPTNTEFDVVITTAAEWNEFATAVNEDFDAKKSQLVSIEADLDFDGIDVVTLGDYKAGNYYDGTIVGNNHKILNLKSNHELVAALSAVAYLEGLTVDATCSYTVGFQAGAQKHFGPLVEYVKGTVKNCHNNANITLQGIEGVTPDKDLYIGGLVGRIREGHVEGCTNSGNITLANTYICESKVYTGGICGYVSNADGVIYDCSNTGKLETAARSAQVFLGGISGLNCGTVDGCTNSGLLTSSLLRPTGDACKHISLGGIVGQLGSSETAASVVNCTNEESGDIMFASSVKLLYAGGIAAQAGLIKNFENNLNKGDITSTAGCRQVAFGGLFGKVTENNSVVLAGTPSTGKISVSGYESSSATWQFIGGIAGIVTSEVSFIGSEINPCTLNNSIIVAAEAKTIKFGALGGVVGSSGDSGDNKSTGKKMTIKNITVNGDIKYSGSGTAFIAADLKACLGGILGSSNSACEIEGCINKAKVYMGDASLAQKNGKYAILGGIVGDISNGDAVINNCKNEGAVYSYVYNNNVWTGYTGNVTAGIVGGFGRYAGNANTITITGCSNTAATYAYRGATAGIAGQVYKATIEGCSSTGKVSRGAPAGGIAAIAVESSINSCTVKATLTAKKAGSTIADCGGIVGIGQKTSVDNSKAFVTATTDDTAKYIGGIIGEPDENCSIASTTACSYGGTVGSTTISKSNVANYVIGNNAITPGTVTYWDGN